MRKLAFRIDYICKKRKTQLLAFAFTAFLFFLSPKFQASSNCTARILLDVVGNLADRFSLDATHYDCSS